MRKAVAGLVGGLFVAVTALGCSTAGATAAVAVSRMPIAAA